MRSSWGVLESDRRRPAPSHYQVLPSVRMGLGGGVVVMVVVRYGGGQAGKGGGIHRGP